MGRKESLEGNYGMREVRRRREYEREVEEEMVMREEYTGGLCRRVDD